MSKFITDNNLALILGNFKTKMTDADTTTLNAAKAYVDSKGISGVGIDAVTVVTQLPTDSIDSKTLYLVPKTTPNTNNVYDQYMYINSAWEMIGDTTVDLTDYFTKEQITATFANYYDKTTADATFAPKSDTYTKEQVDAAIANATTAMTPDEITTFNTTLFS